jgi:voltage-gated potassium channel
MYYIENPAQPEAFSNAFSGAWWAIATLTTVGYGDVFPVTVMGKLFSAIIALLGIGVVAIPTGIISAAFMNEMNESKKQKNSKYEISN